MTTTQQTTISAGPQQGTPPHPAPTGPSTGPSVTSLKENLSLAVGVLPGERPAPGALGPEKEVQVTGEQPEQTSQATAPSSEPLPGDDLLNELETLGSGFDNVKGPVEQSEENLVLTDEQIEKLADPQGTGDYKTRYENLRSLIGKQGNNIGKLRAELAEAKKQFDTLKSQLMAFGELIGFDPQTGAIRPTPKGLIQLIEAASVSADEWNRYLEPLGWKVVESKTDLQKALDEMIPDPNKSFEDKLAEMETWDAAKRRALEERILNAKVQRELARLQQEQQRKEQQRQMQEMLTRFVDELKKRPDANEWIEQVRYWNNILPSSMTPDARIRALKMLAVAAMAPKMLRSLREQTLKWASQRYSRAWDAASAVPTGEIPTYVNERNRPQEGLKIPQAERERLMQLVS